MSWYLSRFLLFAALLPCFRPIEAHARQSVLYGGGPLYSSAATHRDLIRTSGFTTLVIWTIHVSANGDLVLNDQLIVRNGVYVGRVDWPAEIAAFKSGDTSVSRIELGLSGHASSTFLNIRDLVFAQGTGPTGILYTNFQVLRKVLPAIDAINYDEESHIYDENVLYTMKQFSLMLADLGFRIVLDVFSSSDAWTDVFSYVNGQRPGTIDRIDVQCYAGGGGNDPCWWNGLFGGLRVTPGLWAYPASESGGYWSRIPSQVEAQVSAWHSTCNVAGAFMWYLDDMLLATNQYAVADYARAINHALGIDPRRKIAATLYEHTDYHGWSVDVGRGPYGELEVSAAGGQLTQVSALQISPGWQVTLYSEANFSGDTLVKTNSDATLVDDGWNDRCKSMIVLPIQETPVQVYQHTGFWGWSAGFDVGAYALSDLIGAGGLNNDASSVLVTPGYAARLFDNDLFLGGMLLKIADDSSLVDDGWNDRMTSLRVERDLTRWTPVILYQDAGYWGNWTAGLRAGSYTLNQLMTAGALNDDATSVKVADGYTAAFYEHDDFQGNALLKTTDDVCLYDDGWNDRLSSVLISAPTNTNVPVSLIAAGAVWKYFDHTNDLGTVWRSNNYNDAAWSSGPARLGYGNDGEVTQLASNQQWTTYFRRPFYVADPILVTNLVARLTRDDAALIYLNGKQVWSDTNMPPGLITNASPALAALEGTNETNWLIIKFSSSALSSLVSGWNLIAAEVHNQSRTSSDLGFDFELTAVVFNKPAPQLRVSRSGPDLTLLWPEYAHGYALFSATTLPRPVWNRLTNQPALRFGAWTVSLPLDGSTQRFFRLQTN